MERFVDVIVVMKHKASCLQVHLCKCWQIAIDVPGSCCEEMKRKGVIAT